LINRVDLVFIRTKLTLPFHLALRRHEETFLGT
jgi:hypothetical protein